MKLVPGYNEQDLRIKYMNLCKMLESKGLATKADTENMFHNARFDTFCMWYLLNEFGRDLKVM